MSVDTELAAATKPKKQRSKCVACLCSPITLVITVLVLIGLALTLYFSWPRNPDIYVSIPTDRPFVQGVDLQTKSSNTVEGLLQASEANPFTLVLNLTALVTAFSHNYIDVYANKISVLINILDDSGKELPGLSGESVLTGINFAKKANTSVNAVSRASVRFECARIILIIYRASKFSIGFLNRLPQSAKTPFSPSSIPSASKHRPRSRPVYLFVSI